MLDFIIQTPYSVALKLRDKFKNRRLIEGYTQKELSSRSGVSLGSLKRFEKNGKISLESLLKLASILECIDDFNLIANRPKQTKTLDEIINEREEKIPKRGRKS